LAAGFVMLFITVTMIMCFASLEIFLTVSYNTHTQIRKREGKKKKMKRREEINKKGERKQCFKLP